MKKNPKAAADVDRSLAQAVPAAGRFGQVVAASAVRNRQATMSNRWRNLPEPLDRF
jgi:hypothetical protein